MIETPLRPTIPLRDGWTYLPGQADRRWLVGRADRGERVELPHTWNERDTFQLGRESRVGRGSYRRIIEIPEVHRSPGGSWRLLSEGFYGTAEVRLDGVLVARADGEFLGFALELGRSLPPGEHWLSLVLDNRRRLGRLPGGRRVPDFLLHGGLTGAVRLECVGSVHLDADSVRVRSRLDRRSGAARVELAAEVANRSGLACGVELVWTVLDPEGAAVASATGSAVAPPGGPARGLGAEVVVQDARPWSPGSPALYRAEARLRVGDETVDLARIRFGIVDAEFRAGEGLLVEGRRLDLHGCNRHESIPGLGSALPAELHRRDAQLLKRLGCNLVRLSHYPQHPAFLDACDELGIFVYAEIASWKSVSGWPGWRRAARRQMRRMVARDRHHPCVLLWGMGNESRSRAAFRELQAIVRELDPERPTTYAENHLHRARRRRTVGVPDVWGTNYELDVLPEAAAASRLGTVLLSECCNHPFAVKGDEREELEQVAVLEREWEATAELPVLAGYAVWCFADYATEHRRRFRRHAGLHDAWRRPKMAAELFRARHGSEPFAVLFVTAPDVVRPPSRFRRRLAAFGDGEPGSELHVFTNCDRLLLRRDGAELPETDAAAHTVIPLAGAFELLEVRCRRGDARVEARWRRHGSAVALVLAPGTSEPRPGETVPVEVTAVDSRGETARDWNGHVRLRVAGPARLRSFTAAGEALVARGEGRTYLTLSRTPGEVVVTAGARGLMPGRLVLAVGPRDGEG